MDYRQTPCSANATKVKYWLGGCNSQQMKTNVTAIPVYVNTTSPLPVPTYGTAVGGYCDCNPGYTPIGSGSNWSYGLWQGNVKDLSTVQTFGYGSPSTRNVGHCKNYGFKNVAARKWWHGCFNYTSLDACAPTASVSADTTKYLTETQTFSVNNQVKTYISPCGAGGPYLGVKTTRTGGRTAVSSVDPNTGIMSYSSGDPVSTIQTTFYNSAGGATAQFTTTASCDRGCIGGILDVTGAGGNTLLGYDPHCYGDPWSPTNEADDWNNTIVAAFGSGVMPTVTAVTQNQSGWTMTLSYSGAAAGVYSINANSTVTATRSGGSYSIEKHATCDIYVTTDCGSGPFTYLSGAYSINETLTSALSNTNTGASVISDLKGLLGTWDLTNNAQYPWRQDNYTGYAPLVARRGVDLNTTIKPSHPCPSVDDKTSPIADSNGYTYPNPSWTPTYSQRSWFDTNGYQWTPDPSSGNLLSSGVYSFNFDGKIIGAPFSGSNVSASNSGSICAGFFDWYFKDWRFCPTPGGCSGPTYEQYLYETGCDITEAQIYTCGGTAGVQYYSFLPLDSTHWINNLQANYIPRGASVQDINGEIIAVKWAETRIPIKSYNFARPCGSDRVLIDEPNACNFVGELLMDGPLSGVGGTILLCQTDGYDGIYTGCSQTAAGGGNYNLITGSKIANLPSDYNHYGTYNSGTGDSYGLVGKVRFPNCPPICGRDNIYVSATGSHTLVTFSDPQTNLRSGDSIDLYDLSMTSTSAANIVTRIDDSNFVITPSYSGGIINSVYASSTGAPDYHWNDSNPKYEFRYQSWYSNGRGTFTPYGCTSSCLSYSPCAEQVVCISPNSESFANGKTYWMNNDVAIDDPFGAIAQANSELYMVDPLYQHPKTPSSIAGQPSVVQIDDGTCLNDYYNGGGGLVNIFPPIPYVEPSCAPTGSAPSLPSGVSWPTMSPPQQPGNLGYSYSIIEEPWTVYNNMESNCTSSCRFYSFYYGC